MSRKPRFVPPTARGDRGRCALTEPGSGSDAGSLRTTAVPDGDGWRISSKQWCTNGSHASTFLLFARTDPAPPRALAALRLRARRGARGGDRARRRSSVSTRRRPPTCASTASVWTATGSCTRSARLRGRDGDPRRGPDRDRGAGGRDRAGGARHRARVRARAEQFGRKIAEFQAIRFKLADMATGRRRAQLTLRAAWLKQAGLPHGAEGAMAKLFASKVARWASQEAIQVLGGYGYTRVPRGALLPGREDHRDLRGHERDPADRDRPRRLQAASRHLEPAAKLTPGLASADTEGL